MAIFETVSEQMKQALRVKDTARLKALRNIRAAFLTEMKKDNSESLSDETCVGLLRRLEKQRQESIDAFEAAGRSEQAAEERAELGVVQEFLPRLADAATTRAWVEQAIEAAGASQAKDLGRVMGIVMKEHEGEVDGKLARQIAGDLLAG